MFHNYLIKPRKIIFVFLVFFSSLIMFGQPCDDDATQIISADVSTIKYESRNGKTLYYLDDPYTSYSSALKGPQMTVLQRSWKSPPGDNPSPDGKSTIAFETKSCDPSTTCSGHTNQKVNFHFLYKQTENGLAFNERRFIGFNVMVSRDLPSINKDAILVQIWQGSPHGPPFSAVVSRNNDNISASLVFRIKNNETGSNPSSPKIEIGRIQNFEYSQWYQIVLELSPEHDFMSHQSGDTTLGIFYKNSNEENYSLIKYEDSWGYEPENASGDCPYANQCDKVPNPTMDFKFGIYRPSDNTALQARFSAIKIANTFSAADPVCDNTNTLSNEDYESPKEYFRIYPTFITDRCIVDINSNNLKNFKNIEVFDLLGKKVLTTKVTSSTSQVSFQSLKSGPYYIKINNHLEKVIKK